MAFAFVQDSATTGTGTSASDSYDSAVTAGTLLILVLYHTTKVAADMSFLDGHVPRVAADDSNGGCLIIADKIASGSEGNIDISIGGASSGSWQLWIAEFSGVAASGYFDDASFTDYGSVNSAPPGSITPDNATELFIAAAGHVGVSAGENVGSGFTTRGAAALNRLVVGYKIKTTAAAENPAIGWTTAGDAIAGMAAYSTTAIGGASSRPDRHLPRGVARGVTRGVT